MKRAQTYKLLISCLAEQKEVNYRYEKCKRRSSVQRPEEMLAVAGQQAWRSAGVEDAPGTEILRRDIREAKSPQSLKGQQRKRGQNGN